MFTDKKTIVFINKNFIRVGSVILDPQPKFENLFEYPYHKDSLKANFLNIKERYGRSIRLLINDNLIYTTSFPMAKDRKEKREEVLIRASQIIPEDLTKTVWDYKTIEKLKLVQVTAVLRSFYEEIRNAGVVAGLHVEAAESVSTALARITSISTEAYLIIYIKDDFLITANYQGVVLMAENLEEQPSAEDLSDLIDFIREKYNIVIKKIIFSQDKIQQQASHLKIGENNVEIKSLEPMFGLALKKDIRGHDEEILNLDKIF